MTLRMLKSASEIRDSVTGFVPWMMRGEREGEGEEREGRNIEVIELTR